MNRSDLAALQTFVTIAEQGSLRAAARALGVNPPAVSHQLKSFEERLGATLFLRSTRSLTLTDAGRALLEGCGHLLGAMDEALEAVRIAATAGAGRLRITLPHRAWQVIVAPKLAAFQSDHPNIELDLTIDESLTDVVAQGFHAGIRLGDHLQDNMIAVRLSRDEEAALVASPEYIERRGVPACAEELLRHDCIRHRRISTGRVAPWRLRGPRGEVTVEVGGSLIVNDLRTIVDAARLGLGIGWSLKRGVQDDLDRGDLVQVLPALTPPRPGFFLYYPQSFRNFGLLRAFADHMRAR